jgi:hypothetical protein
LANQISTVGGLPAPIFYPSVSSVSKNVWSVIDHIELLVSINHPQFLVSALDIYKHQNNNKIISALSKAEDQSQVVLYDSGIYEVVWGRSKRWCRKRYVKTLKRNNFTHAFDYDIYCLNNRKEPSELVNKSVSSTRSQLNRDAISPIIHCNSISDYVDTCLAISKHLSPKLLAIPERELGHGTVEITRNIKILREALNQLNHYQPIHILGTGNPLSMMAYSFAGADSFDGLDWCQTVVDYESATLHHPLHLDYYKDQSRYGMDSDISFLARCYLHNLEFYEKWTSIIRDCTTSADHEKMVSKYFESKCQDEFLSIFNRNPTQVISR